MRGNNELHEQNIRVKKETTEVYKDIAPMTHNDLNKIATMQQLKRHYIKILITFHYYEGKNSLIQP